MKCEVPGPNVKIISRAMTYLSRVGDEIHIEASQAGLRLSTVNFNKTAFASVKFAPEFFLEFEISQLPENATPDEDKDDRVCKVACKAILPMFRAFSTPPETGLITLKAGDSVISFTYACPSKVTKYFTIPLLTYERFNDPLLPTDLNNKISGHHRIFSNIVGSFHKTTQELSLNCTRNLITIRNYIDDPKSDKESIRSSIELKPAEFESYVIQEDTKLGFSFAEFRAFIHFADQAEVNVRMKFGKAGRPISMNFKSSTGLYKVSLFAATIIDDDNYGSCDSATPDVPMNIISQATNADLNPIESATSNDFNFRGRKTRNRIASIDHQNDDDDNGNGELSNERVHTVVRPGSSLQPSESIEKTVVGPIDFLLSDMQEPSTSKTQTNEKEQVAPVTEKTQKTQHSLLPKNRNEELVFETESQSVPNANLLSSVEATPTPAPPVVAVVEVHKRPLDNDEREKSPERATGGGGGEGKDGNDSPDEIPASPHAEHRRIRLFGRCFGTAQRQRQLPPQQQQQQGNSNTVIHNSVVNSEAET